MFGALFDHRSGRRSVLPLESNQNRVSHANPSDHCCATHLASCSAYPTAGCLIERILIGKYSIRLVGVFGAVIGNILGCFVNCFIAGVIITTADRTQGQTGIYRSTW